MCFLCMKSGGNKRDKLKGTNAQDSQFFADFRRFLLIFAFPGNCSISGAQIFAENRRKPQIFAENRRKPQIFAETRLSPFSLSLLVPPYEREIPGELLLNDLANKSVSN